MSDYTERFYSELLKASADNIPDHSREYKCHECGTTFRQYPLRNVEPVPVDILSRRLYCLKCRAKMSD